MEDGFTCTDAPSLCCPDADGDGECDGPELIVGGACGCRVAAPAVNATGLLLGLLTLLGLRALRRRR